MGKRKLWKKKEPKTTDYTIADFVDDEVDKFGKQIEAVMAEAEAGGKHGVMIVATSDVFVSDLVPYGKVFRAGSMDAVNRLRTIKEGAAE